MATIDEGPRLVSPARRRAQILRTVPPAPAVDEREGLPPPGAVPASAVALLRAPALDPPSEVELQPPFGADPLPSTVPERAAAPPFWEPGPRASARRRKAGAARRDAAEPGDRSPPGADGQRVAPAVGGRGRQGPAAAGTARASRDKASPPLRFPRDAGRPDAERGRSAAVAYLVERELRVNGLSSTQVGRPQAERRLFVARAEVDVESSIPQVTAWAALRLFVGMCVEVLNGFRPAGQLRPMSDPHRFTDIADQLVRRTVRVRMSPAQAARQGRLVRVRRMLVCEPLPGIAEAAVVLEQGDTCWSMAVRMERAARTGEPTSWRCVLVQVI